MQTLETWWQIDEAISGDDWGSHPEHPRSTLVFRGLARADYSNVSSLARLRGDFAALERHLIRNFRKYAHQEAPGPTTWDWLALGQQHGLPTRLLDWTFSPLVALHFATASWPEDDAVLWAVDCVAVHATLPPRLRTALEEEGAIVFTTDLLGAHAPDLGALDELREDDPFCAFFEPPTLDQRIANQAAVLSVIADPSCHMDDWLESHPDAWRAWRIPRALKAQVRERLDQAQITERLMMPGLDGLAAWLRRYYAPQSVADYGDRGATMSGRDERMQQEGSMT